MSAQICSQGYYIEVIQVERDFLAVVSPFFIEKKNIINSVCSGK